MMSISIPRNNRNIEVRIPAGAPHTDGQKSLDYVLQQTNNFCDIILAQGWGEPGDLPPAVDIESTPFYTTAAEKIPFFAPNDDRPEVRQRLTKADRINAIVLIVVQIENRLGVKPFIYCGQAEVLPACAQEAQNDLHFAGTVQFLADCTVVDVFAGENVVALPVAFEIERTNRIHLVQLIRVGDLRFGIGAASQVRRQAYSRNGFPHCVPRPVVSKESMVHPQFM
jgi:hypothetical protein